MSPIILVTGANRGIGFAIVHATALRIPKATYLLACRSQEAAEKAIEELKKLGVSAQLDIVVFDVTNDVSIIQAKDVVERKYGTLDILVNNAAIAVVQKTTELTDLRDSFNATFNANVTSVAAVTSTFLPLLRRSSRPQVIHVSSGRASLQRSTGPNFPPTAVLPYSISKVALNALTIEQQKIENARTGNDPDGEKVDFYTINPGHCRTAFNGWSGLKDPLDGAEVVVRLVMAKRGEWKAGSFLEFEDGKMREVPW